MAGTMNYTYDPEQVVWVITNCTDNVTAVREGTVYSVRGLVLTPPDVGSVEYNIILTDEKSAYFYSEEDTFATLDEAITEYEIRLTP